VFSTQGRMVSGSDYNELPVQTNLAVKLKAVNRVYSGQSRFIDLNDPTGNYQNTQVFADDGAFYLLNRNESVEVSHTVASTDEMMSKYIADIASGVSLRDFYANYLYEHGTTAAQSAAGKIFNPTSNRFSNDYLFRSEVRREVKESLELNRTFALGFDNDPAQGWYVMTSSEVNPDLSATYQFDNTAIPGPNSWLIHCEYTSNFWRVTSRGLNYVFESERDCKFYFSSDFRSIDPQTGRAGSDTVNILKAPNALKGKYLEDIDGNRYHLTSDLILKLEDMFTYSDGFHEPSRVKVRFNDSENDGVVDVPFTYKALKSLRPEENSIVHIKRFDTDGYPVERLIKRLEPSITQLLPGEYGFVERMVGESHYVDIYKGNVGYLVPRSQDIILANAFVTAEATLVYGTDGSQFIVREGVNDLIYQWKHYAPSSHRIDPAISNIIDIFVLTREYNDAMISWRNAGADPLTQPKAPSELNLRTTFNQLEEFKMFSDEIIWRPVKFKLIFGQSAEPAYRSKFKIVKLVGTSMSDGEIKSKVIESLRSFFEVNNWDFGETFFFSELGAYIHRQLSTAISSVEIVPVLDDSYFGNLREIRCAPDELFFATAQVSDIDIITANTPTNLRIR
jgi:hypothetical protein